MEDDGAKRYHEVYTEHFHLVVVVLLSQHSIKHQQILPYLPAEEVKLINSELIYLSDLSYQRETSKLCSQLAVKLFLIGRLETRDIQGIWLFKILGHYAR